MKSKQDDTKGKRQGKSADAAKKNTKAAKPRKGK